MKSPLSNRPSMAGLLSAIARMPVGRQLALAFGLVLGAIAVATALAFGLGGRDAAGKIAQRWADDYLQRAGKPRVRVGQDGTPPGA